MTVKKKLDECPGWDHEIAIGWRSKNIKQKTLIAIKIEIYNCDLQLFFFGGLKASGAFVCFEIN